MEPATGEPLRPTAVIAARVHELRTRRGWTAARLAAELEAVGVPWQRVVVTKLETGRRQSVSVEELLALAYVLDVAPVHLMVPTDATDDDRYCVTPASERAVLRPSAVRAWIRGVRPVSTYTPGGALDGRRYFSEVPPGEYPTVPRFANPEVGTTSDDRGEDPYAHAGLPASRYRPGGSDGGAK